MERKETKVSLSTMLLIIAIIVIIVMGYCIYRISKEKVAESEKVAALESTVSNLESRANNLQETIDNIKNTINNTEKENKKIEKNDEQEEGIISGIRYKIYNNEDDFYSQYSKKGYYIDTEDNINYNYIIAKGKESSGGYDIKISDVQIDDNRNVNVIVSETEPERGYSYIMVITYPICRLELSEKPNSIIIKNTNGEIYNEITEKE